MIYHDSRPRDPNQAASKQIDYSMIAPDKKPFAVFGKLVPVFMLGLIPALLLFFVAKLSGIAILIGAATFITLTIVICSSIMIIICSLIAIVNYRKFHRR